MLAIPAALLSIIFGVAGIAVPEIDAIVARRFEKPPCYVLHFDRTKTVAIMTPTICSRAK
jgi:hypothetical protein